MVGSTAAVGSRVLLLLHGLRVVELELVVYGIAGRTVNCPPESPSARLGREAVPGNVLQNYVNTPTPIGQCWGNLTKQRLHSTLTPGKGGKGVSVHVSFAKRCLGNGSQPQEVPLVDKERKIFGSMCRRHAKETWVYLDT